MNIGHNTLNTHMACAGPGPQHRQPDGASSVRSGKPGGEAALHLLAWLGILHVHQAAHMKSCRYHVCGCLIAGKATPEL